MKTAFKFSLITAILSIAAIPVNAQQITDTLNEKTESMRSDENTSTAIYQIRIYELNEHNKEQFFIRFRDHAGRIMKRHGFDILNMWQTYFNGKPEFVYLLKWDDEQTMEQAWENFFSDEEWIEIRDRTNSQYGILVAERKEDRILKSVAP